MNGMVRTEAFFLPGAQDARYCVVFYPESRPHGCVLLVPPFAEEANKSRSNLARIARACAEDGYLAMIGDVGGTGDSAGDFGSASWAGWVADLKRFAGWLQQHSEGRLFVIGLRLGVLLASSAIRDGLPAHTLVTVAPVLNGKLALTQFLRLGAAADLGADPDAKIDTRGLRAQLDGGKAVEVAGYRLSPELAGALDAATFDLPDAVRLGWIEVSSSDALSPASARALDSLTARGFSVRSKILAGPAFWLTQEIELLPDLPALCVGLLGEWPDSGATP